MLPEQFAKQFKWSPETLQVARESNFRCVYCNHYFFGSVDAWTQFNVDHLRPGTRDDRDDRVENKVAACWTCNKLKSTFDPGAEQPDLSKVELISIARDFILEVRRKREEKVTAMKLASESLE